MFIMIYGLKFVGLKFRYIKYEVKIFIFLHNLFKYYLVVRFI